MAGVRLSCRMIVDDAFLYNYRAGLTEFMGVGWSKTTDYSCVFGGTLSNGGKVAGWFSYAYHGI